MHYVFALVFMLVFVERHVDSSKGMRGSRNDKLNDENELDGTTTNEAKRWIGYMDSAKGEGERERRNGLAKDCGEKGKRWWKEGGEKQCAWDSNTTRADEDDRALVCHSKRPSFDDKAVVIGDMDAGKREKKRTIILSRIGQVGGRGWR